MKALVDHLEAVCLRMVLLYLTVSQQFKHLHREQYRVAGLFREVLARMLLTRYQIIEEIDREKG